METKVNLAAVGAFVIGLVLAVIVVVIWLSSGLTIQQYKTYKVFMTESVSGLNIDSPVEYNGVGVGSVASVELNDTNPHIVDVMLNIKKNTPITIGTRAVLKTRGLTGTAYIGLDDKGLDRRKLIPMGEEEYPVIKTAPSLLLQLDSIIKELSADLKKVSASIETLLDKDNLLAFKKTLSNIQILTNSFKEQSGNVKTIMYETARASKQIPNVLKAGQQTLLNFDATSNNISALSLELKQNPAMIIRGRAPTQLGPGE